MILPGLDTKAHLGLNSIFLFLFCKNPLSRKYFSLPFLQATSLSLSRTLEELFELKFPPLKGLDMPRALLPELQRNKDTISCCVLGAEVPKHHQKQLTQTLIDRLLKTQVLIPILDCERRLSIFQTAFEIFKPENRTPLLWTREMTTKIIFHGLGFHGFTKLTAGA